MKVKDLMDKLKGINQDIEIVYEAFDHYDCPYWADANFVSVEYDDVSENKVLLIKESKDF